MNQENEVHICIEESFAVQRGDATSVLGTLASSVPLDKIYNL